MPSTRKLTPLNMRVSKDWTFSWEALKYKVLGTHRICHVCRLCHPSAVLPDPSWLPPHQASFFCQKRFLERYREAGLLCPVSSFDLSFRRKGKPTDRAVQLLFADINISYEYCDSILISVLPFAQRFSAIRASPTFHF